MSSDVKKQMRENICEHPGRKTKDPPSDPFRFYLLSARVSANEQVKVLGVFLVIPILIITIVSLCGGSA